MATIRRQITLKHQANLGEGVEDVELAAGETVSVLKEWQDRYLIKNTAGQLFNVPKECVER